MRLRVNLGENSIVELFIQIGFPICGDTISSVGSPPRYPIRLSSTGTVRQVTSVFPKGSAPGMAERLEIPESWLIDRVIDKYLKPHIRLSQSLHYFCFPQLRFSHSVHSQNLGCPNFALE